MYVRSVYYIYTVLQEHTRMHGHRPEEVVTLCPIPLRQGLLLSLDPGWQAAILMILLLFPTPHDAGVTDTGVTMPSYYVGAVDASSYPLIFPDQYSCVPAKLICQNLICSCCFKI